MKRYSQFFQKFCLQMEGRDIGTTESCKVWAEGDNQEWGKGESGYELWIPSLSNVGYILGIFA